MRDLTKHVFSSSYLDILNAASDEEMVVFVFYLYLFVILTLHVMDALIPFSFLLVFDRKHIPLPDFFVKYL
jgi:hypothetical protein